MSGKGPSSAMLDPSFETSGINYPTTQWHIPKDLTPINNAKTSLNLGNYDMFVNHRLQRSVTSLAMCFVLINQSWTKVPVLHKNSEYRVVNTFHRSSNKTGNARIAQQWGATVQHLLTWKNNNYYILWVCVCSLRYPNAMPMGHIAICGPPTLQYSSTLSHNGIICEKALLNTKFGPCIILIVE